MLRSACALYFYKLHPSGLLGAGWTSPFLRKWSSPWLSRLYLTHGAQLCRLWHFVVTINFHQLPTHILRWGTLASRISDTNWEWKENKKNKIFSREGALLSITLHHTCWNLILHLMSSLCNIQQLSRSRVTNLGCLVPSFHQLLQGRTDLMNLLLTRPMHLDTFNTYVPPFSNLASKMVGLFANYL